MIYYKRAESLTSEDQKTVNMQCSQYRANQTLSNIAASERDQETEDLNAGVQLQL